MTDMRRLGSTAWLDENGEDEVWTPEDICEVFEVSIHTVYKLNAVHAIPYSYFSKHCRYFRSDVLNYFMSRDSDIIDDDPSEFKRLPLDELPRIFRRRRRPPENVA